MTSTPITGELRDAMPVSYGHVDMDGTRFDQLCDAIDSIHANLERENASLKAELDRLIGEQECEQPTPTDGITNELREYASRYKGSHDAWSGIGDELTAIADRIDAEHEKVKRRAGQLLADAEKDRDYNYANWQECKQKVLQGSITLNELDAEVERLKDELECRIELPKDADGEPIHIGDVMEWCNGTFTVHELKVTEDGWTTWDSEHGYTVHDDECHHRRPDTWERIIEDAIDSVDGGPTIATLVARCKALAGGADG